MQLIELSLANKPFRVRLIPILDKGIHHFHASRQRQLYQFIHRIGGINPAFSYFQRQ
ncbi:hypothetical protein D3C77_429540 [compost metagenome]